MVVCVSVNTLIPVVDCSLLLFACLDFFRFLGVEVYVVDYISCSKFDILADNLCNSAKINSSVLVGPLPKA